jgi:SAM-dependent methyltransferase
MDWHTRYLQQAQWTAQLRSHLFKKAGIDAASRLLEIGCGTGAVLAGLPSSAAGLYGIDLSRSALAQAALHSPAAMLGCADATHLPFLNASIDMTFCHFTLLWVKAPLQVVMEMRRVTRSAGAVLALAEPDYGGRIDFPAELTELGRWQAESLQRQGADPLMGRKLAGIFTQAGLRHVETGILGGEWKSLPDDFPPGSDANELEWEVLQADLAGQVTPEQLDRMRQADQLARQRHERVLFVPTFYAWGVV